MKPPLPTLAGTPTLETPRLVLRMPELSDFPAYRDYATSDRTRFTGGPKPHHTAFEKFASMIGHWALRGFGRFIITDRTSGQALGHVGPMQLDAAAIPELTWTLWSKEAEGKGVAFEASCAVKAWLFETLEWQEAAAEVHRDNHASQSLALRLGGQVWKDGPKRRMEDGIVYRFSLSHARSDDQVLQSIR
ncbi:GNAT family N-acetyltransferase [Roseibium algae]|uniref:GNAT family N-acetyltransferase n=1 Tax=Roseibium algae TaxID=3123038 RepID=A0ABU8THJ4_9HYPH